MHATISETGTLRKQLTVSFTPAEVAARRDQVLRQVAGQAKLDGFRPGKSPKALVERRFGSVADQKVQEELVDEGFKKAVQEHQLRPIGPITNEKVARDDGLTLVCSFEVKPAITLPAPKSITVTTSGATVSDQDVSAALDNLCIRAGTMDALAVGETIAKDDSVTLAGTVAVEGKEVRKLHDFHHLVGGYALLGTQPEEVIALFKEHQVGGQLTFTTTLPPSFTPPEAAGKQAEVSVTIQSAQRQRPAQANDELAKRLGLESIAQLSAKLREQLEQQKGLELHQKQLGELSDALLAQVAIEIPPALLEGVLRDQVEPKARAAEQEGKPAEELAKLRADGRSDSEKMLKRYLLLDAVGEQLQVQVTREDIESQIEMAAERSRRKPQEVADQLVKSGQLNQVVQEIREAKSLELLLEQVLAGAATLQIAAPAHGEPGHVHGPECGHAHG
jgi:trigger factor